MNVQVPLLLRCFSGCGGRFILGTKMMASLGICRHWPLQHVCSVGAAWFWPPPAPPLKTVTPPLTLPATEFDSAPVYQGWALCEPTCALGLSIPCGCAQGPPRLLNSLVPVISEASLPHPLGASPEVGSWLLPRGLVHI